ncbi:transcription termination factor 3, mitochondrial-like [Clytia hemisphaerica]
MIIKCPGILLVKQEDLSLQKRFKDYRLRCALLYAQNFQRRKEHKSTKAYKSLNHLQELSLQPRLTQDRCLYLIQKIPQILLIDTKSNLTEKIKNLQTLGFNDQQIFELVMKHPAILTYSVDNVKAKVTFISEKANGRLALLVKFPRVFTSSLVRLEERYHYLLQEGFLTEKSRFTENKLRALVLTKDSDFVYRVTNGRMKDYRQFQKDFQTDNKFDDFNEGEEEEINDQFDFDDKEDIEISR